MQSSSLENFGKELMGSVRDKTYGQYLLDKNGYFKSRENIKKLIGKINDQDALDKIVLHVIDKALFNLLVMLQDNDATLSGSWGDFNQDDSDLLCAELWTEDGWIEQFSAYKPSKE